MQPLLPLQSNGRTTGLLLERKDKLSTNACRTICCSKIPRTPTSATSQARPLQLQFKTSQDLSRPLQQNDTNAPATAPAPSSQTNDTAPAPTIKIAPAPAPEHNAPRYRTNDDYDDRRNSRNGNAPTAPPTNGDTSNSESNPMTLQHLSTLRQC